MAEGMNNKLMFQADCIPAQETFTCLVWLRLANQSEINSYVKNNYCQQIYPDLDFRYSLDVGLVEGGEDGVDGHGCGGEVEVVEEDGQVVVQAPRRAEPDVEGPARHALDRPKAIIHFVC